MITKMIRVVVLASGSSGNSVLVEAAGTRILVDAGLSCKRLTERLQQAGIEPESLAGAIVTHEHGDHARGLRRVCALSKMPAYANPGTAEALGYGSNEDTLDWKLFRTGSAFTIGSLSIETFPVPHDACDPIGLVIRHGSQSFGILTDLGYAGHAVLDRVCMVDSLLIESNHDIDMLQSDTKRPWGVKQRIISRHGHLSNEAAAKVVAHCFNHRLRQVVLGHLSRDCNTSELARQAVLSQLNGSAIDLHVVHQDDPVFSFSEGM